MYCLGSKWLSTHQAQYPSVGGNMKLVIHKNSTINENLILVLIILISIFSRCTSDDINQSKYRNQDYIWFIAEGSENGTWYKIDYSAESPILTNGNCILFYSNGKVREKYSLDEFGDYDTIFLYDINGQLTHYTFDDSGRFENYIINDGEFKAYDVEGSLTISGTASKHQLISYSLHGNIKQFYQLLLFQTTSWRGAENFFKETTKIIKEANEKGYHKIPTVKLDSLDSLRTEQIETINLILKQLSEMKTSPELIKVKHYTILFIESTHLVLDANFKEILFIMRQEWNNENKDKCHALATDVMERSKISDFALENAEIDFVRSIQLSDFFLKYFEEINEQFK